MLRKFGDTGVDLRVDAFAGQEFYGVEFFPEGSDRPFYAKSAQSLKTRSNMLMPLEIPERVRVVWREIDKPITGKYGQMTYEGPLVGDYTIDVGSRIPQEVLESIRKEGGQLRLKFRLGNDGVYFGWDIERRPGYDPRKRDQRGNIIGADAVHFLAGGDFREAEIFNGQVVRKGWYIDKKTGQRIDTDF
ncbi:MAG: hypothetical protein ACOY4U_04210 [Pseudomonadota bacterium]